MKLILFSLCFLFFGTSSNPEKIIWTENHQLTWEDFKGKPIPSAGFVASSHTGIGFQYSYAISNGEIELDYSVESFFKPNSSWYFPKKVNTHILKHEQGHFNISELHARMLKKAIDSKKFTKNIKKEIEKIYHNVEQKRRAMQTKFDAETDHSRNEDQEVHWENYIAKQLAEYESWK